MWLVCERFRSMSQRNRRGEEQDQDVCPAEGDPAQGQAQDHHPW